MIYDGVINKPPLNEETLAHYGVLGMKWGVRKNPEKAYSKAAKELAKRKKKVVKADKKYKRALNRPFGSLYRSTSQKLNKLNKKQNKLRKWEEAIVKNFEKEYDRIRKTSNTDEEKNKRLSRLEKAYNDNFKVKVKIKAEEKNKSSKATSSSIENKVKNARKTGKYDMEFLEGNYDVDSKTGDLLKGKALDDAYREYLKKKK